jgi:dihydrolipoamide dehydrogenase
VVSGLVKNVAKLLEGHGVKLIRGTARLVSGEAVEVSRDASAGEKETYRSGAILLATGSEPAAIPSIPFNGQNIVGSTEALSFDSVPVHLGIVGGGAIGLELGSVWLRLGSRVTVIEMLPKIAGSLDGQLSRGLERSLARQGMAFRLNTRVLEADADLGGVRVTVESDGRREELSFDRLLVSIGRKPLTRGLGLEDLGVRVDRRGFVIVDSRYRTNIPTVYAIGDMIPGPMLAHKASAEGIAAVECIAGLPGEVNYDTIPWVIYTSPEIASVGLTEEQVKERGVAYVVGSYPMAGVARARCMGETVGFVKIICHGRSGRVLGVHLLAPRASELIGECEMAMDRDATWRDILRIVHAHPTLSEALQEAASSFRRSSKPP